MSAELTVFRLEARYTRGSFSDGPLADHLKIDFEALASPALPAAAYVGGYQGDLYGMIEIAKTNAGCHAR
jgi:hypothetical protein